MKYRRHTALKPNSGFTLIELLVVILILATLMATALPLYLQATAYSQTRTCRENMRTLGNAVQSDYFRNNRSGYGFYFSAGGKVTLAKVPDLQAIPTCPSGGTYNFHAGGSSGSPFAVQCTIGAHGDYYYGVDTR